MPQAKDNASPQIVSEKIAGRISTKCQEHPAPIHERAGAVTPVFKPARPDAKVGDTKNTAIGLERSIPPLNTSN
jgi:hypothetical protein